MLGALPLHLIYAFVVWCVSTHISLVKKLCLFSQFIYTEEPGILRRRRNQLFKLFYGLFSLRRSCTLKHHCGEVGEWQHSKLTVGHDCYQFENLSANLKWSFFIVTFRQYRSVTTDLNISSSCIMGLQRRAENGVVGTRVSQRVEILLIG